MDSAPPFRDKLPDPLNDPLLAVTVKPNVPVEEVISALRITLPYADKVKVALPPVVFAIVLLTVISPVSEPGLAPPVEIETLVPAFREATMLEG